VRTGRILIILAVAAAGLAAGQSPQQPPQQMNDFERDRALSTLHEISSDVKKHYYDPKFHGLNPDALFKQTEEEMKSSASFNQAITKLAAALDKFDDSHLFYRPPPRPYRLEYGWRMKMIGDKCYVTAVRPGTDAEAKGLRRGDQVLAVNGFPTSRDTLWKIEYLYRVLRPQPSLKIAVASPGGQPRELSISALISEKAQLQNINFDNIWELIHQQDAENRIFETTCATVNDVVVCKIPEFVLSPVQVDDILRKFGSHSAVVLDLRENPGGAVDSLERFLGGLFDHEVKISDRQGRKDMKPQLARPHGKTYTGKIIVLVDSKSASAAELLARVMQLENRGTVVGDRSEGAVMEAEGFGYRHGTIERYSFYAASITRANLIMKDGKSLEKIGVTPDDLQIPTPEDMAAGRDTVLAHALGLAGAKVSSEDAGKLFPVKWPLMK
jgi:C-terminal processing protease CtpA/Prc